MLDPGAKIARLRGLIQTPWSDAHTARVQRRVQQHQRRRQALGVAGAAALVLCLLVCAGRWLYLRPAAVAGRQPPPGALATAGALRLADRSLAVPAGPTDRLRLAQEGPQRTVVEVVQGRARFDVTHRAGRLFRVEAGRVSVEVLGTAFTVDRGAAQVRVAVERGRVRVLWDGQEQVLEAGQSGSFPPSPVAPARASAPPATTPAAPPGAAPRPRALDPAEALLRAADAARLGPDPGAALVPLRRLLQEHRGDARAPLAAFTMGKLQLAQPGQAEAAARSFALTQALDPDGALAEDALAREVEAWAQAGQAARASERAAEYLRRYPEGSQRSAVRRFSQVP